MTSYQNPTPETSMVEVKIDSTPLDNEFDDIVKCNPPQYKPSLPPRTRSYRATRHHVQDDTNGSYVKEFISVHCLFKFTTFLVMTIYSCLNSCDVPLPNLLVVLFVFIYIMKYIPYVNHPIVDFTVGIGYFCILLFQQIYIKQADNCADLTVIFTWIVIGTHLYPILALILLFCIFYLYEHIVKNNRKMSKKILKRLKSSIVIGNDQTIPKTCSICLENFNIGETIHELPCHHEYHKECVDTWLLEHSDTCPLCRISVTNETTEPQLNLQ